MTTRRRRPIARVLIGLVVAPVLVGSFWEAVTFYQEDDPWLAGIVLATLGVLAAVVWLVSGERPEERAALVMDRAAERWSALSRRVSTEPAEPAVDRRFVADSRGNVVEVGPLVGMDA